MNWGMLTTWRSMLSLRSNRDVMGSRWTVALRYPHSQTLHRFKSGDLRAQVIGNCWLIILSSSKWRWISCFTQRAMCGGAPSCIKTVVLPYRLAWTAGIMDSSNNVAYRWPVRVHLTLPVVWKKFTAVISVTTESSASNFRQLDLLGPPTCILAAIGYLKAMVYRDPITSLSDLKESIERRVLNIPQFIQSGVQYFYTFRPI